MEEKFLDINMIIALAGGLGLFLYGMNMMGEGLENAAGSKLKFILEKVTKNPFQSVLIGAIVTALIQSSSATTVMVVGFVNSGLLNLVQATGIIMGANIGTTATAFIVSLNIDFLVPLLIFSGSLLFLFSKVKSKRDMATIILGFGLLMLGMNLMGAAMEPLGDSETFKSMIIAIKNQWYLGVMLGLIITMIIQSSSATTGILVALTATGSITLEAAFPIILGANVGTCITAIISSISANKMAKKAAVIHLLFNVLGAIIFLPFGPILIKGVLLLSPVNVKLQISFIHLIFNVLNTLVLLPFAGVLISAANKIIGEDKIEKDELDILDWRLLQTPAIAEGQVVLQTVKLAELAKHNVELAVKGFVENQIDKKDEILKNEERINVVTEKISQFLVELSKSNSDLAEFSAIKNTYQVINDIERIGDHGENILGITQEKINKGAELTEDGKEEIEKIFSVVISFLDTVIRSYKDGDVVLARSVDGVEKQIRALHKMYRKSHIKRLNEGKCSVISGVLFLDLMSNLERVGDHTVNIAETIV